MKREVELVDRYRVTTVQQIDVGQYDLVMTTTIPYWQRYSSRSYGVLPRAMLPAVASGARQRLFGAAGEMCCRLRVDYISVC